MNSNNYNNNEIKNNITPDIAIRNLGCYNKNNVKLNSKQYHRNTYQE